MAKAIETIVSVKDKRRFSLKAQAEDLAEARKALESAANISRGLWFTFMTLAAGVFITTGTVTHRDLFLETPVKLPLLNAELPLVAFFWVTPLMFILFHAYLLLNLTSLGVNVRHYFDLVDDTGLDPKSKNKLYLQLPNFMVVQMLRARREKYWTMMGYALHIVVALTVVVGPLVALLFLQVKFLPYHEHGVTWVQRAVITLDAAAIFYFWPEIVGKPASLLVWYVRMMLYSVVLFIFLFSFFVARFPGEAYYKNGPFESSGIAKWLFRGKVDDVEGKTESFFSDRLVLGNQDFIDLDDDKLGRADTTVSVRGRDLVGAYLARTDLRKADFTGANLSEADFSSARLQRAIFENPPLPPSSPTNSDILKTAGVDASKTPGGDGPKTNGANMPKTLLRDVNFSGACLNGVNFNAADMRRAILSNANLDGAILTNAQLQSATFDYATLVNAKLNHAHMQGTSFIAADLSNAILVKADLTGSAIFQSQMEGAKLDSATMQAATFASNYVRGLSETKVDWSTTFVEGLADDGTLAVTGDAPLCNAISAVGPATPVKPPERSVVPLGPRAREIMWGGVNKFPGRATDNDFGRWSKRLEILKSAICDDKDFGADVLKRVVGGPSIGTYPALHLGPFRREFADEIMVTTKCAESEAFPPALKAALKCWQSANPKTVGACVRSALKNGVFPTPLP